MVNSKLIVGTLLVILGAGSLGGGLLVKLYVGDQLDTGIRDSLVLNGKDDPDYDDWVSSEDAGDAPLYKKYYFWNLTNPDEYLDGATPKFKELGPYVYRQFDRKIDVSFGDNKVTYRTYTYYKFMANMSSGNVDDMIVNINPQYLGVLAKAGSELGLLTGFVGPTLTTVTDGLTGDFATAVSIQGAATALNSTIEGLTSDFATGVQIQGAASALNQTYHALLDDFSPQVIIQGTAVVLAEVMKEVTQNLHLVVNATMAANLIASNFNTVAGNTNSTFAYDSFFNSTTFATDTGANIEGISEYAGSSLGYSLDAAQKLLVDGLPALNISGWIEDLDQGRGILEFLGAYAIASNVSDTSLDMNTLSALYGADSTLLGAAANYLQSHLIGEKVPAIYNSTYKKTTLEGAQEMFFEQWANGTALPSAIDLTGDNVSDGFEVGIPVPTGISLNSSEAIFNSSNPYALTNESGIFVWFQAMAGDTSADDLISLTFSLNATQKGMLYSWLNSFKDGFGRGSVLAELGLSSTSQIAFVQWGSPAVTGGLSVLDLDPTAAPNYPEFWAWSTHVSKTNLTLNYGVSYSLLNGTMNLRNSTNVGMFLNLTAGGDFSTIDSIWGLNSSESVTLAGYLNYLISDFVMPTFLPLGVSVTADLGYLQWGSPAITGGQSILDLDPTAAPNYPEFWAWNQHVANSSLTFNLTQSKAVLTGDYSLLNSTNLGMFLSLIAAGDFGTIDSLWGLNSSESVTLAGYLNYLISDFVLPTFSPLGVTSVSDLGYLQWGSPVIGAGSLFQINASLGFYPELWAYSEYVMNSSYSFPISKVKSVLTGVYSFLNSTNVGMFLKLASSGKLSTIESLWGLNSSDVTVLSGYVRYLIDNPIRAVISPVINSGGGLITHRTVDQWLWEYDDRLLLFLKENGQDIDPSANLFTNHTSVSDAQLEPTSTFYTGADDLEKVGQYVEWREQSKIEGIWSSPEVVRGTAATQFAPGVTEDETLVAWVSDLLRAVNFVYKEDTTVEGIKLLRFVLSENTLRSSSEYSPNAKYYQGISGLANMTSAKGIPLFLSKPHFLDAAPYLGKDMGITAGDRSLHDTFIDVEPTTGAVMNARKRLQISLMVNASDYFSKNIKDDILPLAWIEEGGSIQPAQAEAFKNSVYNAQSIQKYSFIGGPVLSLFFFSMATVVIMKRE